MAQQAILCVILKVRNRRRETKGTGGAFCGNVCYSSPIHYAQSKGIAPRRCFRYNLDMDIADNAKKYIIALNQGTTTSRAVIFNRNRERVSFSQRALAQFYP